GADRTAPAPTLAARPGSVWPGHGSAPAGLDTASTLAPGRATAPVARPSNDAPAAPPPSGAATPANSASQRGPCPPRPCFLQRAAQLASAAHPSVPTPSVQW